MSANAKVYFPQGAREMVVGAEGRVSVLPGGAINLPVLTPEKGAKATLTTGDDSDSNKVTITAVEIGAAGSDITIAYVADEEADAVKVVVDGNAITVTCVAEEDVNDEVVVISTAAEVVAALTTDDDAAALVAAEGVGTGEVEAMKPTALEGGKDTTPAKKGDVCCDATNLYIATADIAVSDAGTAWKKVTIGSSI